MASIRKKGAKELPPISTASLPDIVFMLLFFFMVVTVMRDTELKVKNSLPKATELQKLQKKSLVSYIFIGSPTKSWAGKYGTAPTIQLNDKFADVDDITIFIENERRQVTPQKLVPFMTTSLKVDKDVKMGIVQEVKTKLRKLSALKINYSSLQRAEVY